MDSNINLLVEGMERLGLIATRIRKNVGQTPKIEVDIILEELRNLYMVALQLDVEETKNVVEFGIDLSDEAGRVGETEQKRHEEVAAKRIAEEKPLAEEAAAKKMAEERAHKIVTEEFQPIFAPPIPKREEPPMMEPQLEKLAGNPNDELFAEESVEKPQESLLDLFQSERGEGQPRLTLADTLNRHQRNAEERLENHVHSKKVEDLRTIININDKFSFMSELFHNNMKAYNDFILKLNTIASRTDALAFVAEVATTNNWDANSVVVKGFYKIFDRKF